MQWSSSHKAHKLLWATLLSGVSNLPNDNRMFLEEEEWNDLFGNSREFTSFDGVLNYEKGEIEAENNSKNTRIK